MFLGYCVHKINSSTVTLWSMFTQLLCYKLLVAMVMARHELLWLLFMTWVYVWNMCIWGCARVYNDRVLIKTVAVYVYILIATYQSSCTLVMPGSIVLLQNLLKVEPVGYLRFLWYNVLASSLKPYLTFHSVCCLLYTVPTLLVGH